MTLCGEGYCTGKYVELFGGGYRIGKYVALFCRGGYYIERYVALWGGGDGDKYMVVWIMYRQVCGLVWWCGYCTDKCAALCGVDIVDKYVALCGVDIVD